MNVTATSSEYLINDTIDGKVYKGKASIYSDGGVDLNFSIDNSTFINYGKNDQGTIYVNLQYNEEDDIMDDLMNIINDVLTSIGYNN